MIKIKLIKNNKAIIIKIMTRRKSQESTHRRVVPENLRYRSANFYENNCGRLNMVDCFHATIFKKDFFDGYFPRNLPKFFGTVICIKSISGSRMIYCISFVFIIHPKISPLTTNVPHHKETSQSIYNANQLTGFYMMGNIVR